jgi:hypothetical protein
MEPEQLALRSHLFMVRLWLEPLGEGKSEWRGKVQHVPSGEAQYIRDWATLQAFMEKKLSESGWVEEPLTPRHSE